MSLVPRFLFSVGLILGFAPAWGATLEYLTLNNLIAKSTAIVEGTVTSSSASYTNGVIYTHYQIAVQQQWTGSAQTSIDVLVPGGTVKGIRQTFPGTPQLIPGRQYVLFLWTSSKNLTFPLGFTQGIFNLVSGSSGTIAAQMPTTETMLSQQTGHAVNNQPISMPLAQLVAEIHSASTQSGGGTKQ
ncbi:MAG TPA: hypothetical protein VMT86_21665 [Bryobacteraceae bacterium]|nr:hypothetical protein [Bryobacteraceae bacterium]